MPAAFSNSVHTVSRDGLIYHAAGVVRLSAAVAAGPLFSLEWTTTAKFLDIIKVTVGTGFDATTAVASSQSYQLRTNINTAMSGGSVVVSTPQNRSINTLALTPVSLASVRISDGATTLGGFGGGVNILGSSGPQPRSNGATSVKEFSGKDFANGYFCGLLPAPSVSVVVFAEAATVIGDVITVSISWCEGLPGR